MSLKIFTRALNALYHDNPIVVVSDAGVSRKQGVSPLTRSIAEQVHEKYVLFKPAYRTGLSTLTAVLHDVRYHDELELYIGLYRAWVGGQYEYFVWLWRDGTMIELEQRNVVELREIDRRAMKLANPWLR